MSVKNILTLAKKPYLDESLTRPDWTKDVSRNESLLWLDKNENLDPILSEKLNGLIGKLKPTALNTYPETAKIYEKLARLNKLAPKNFILTNGSDGSIRVVFDVFINQGDKVLHTAPTFAMYSVYSKMFGAQVIPFDYDESSEGPVLNIEKFIKTIKNERPKLVCLPNPDSPTGTVVVPEKLLEIIKLTDELGILLLIDEAYYPFYNHSVLSNIMTYPNLLVCRTFSKAWGVAGVRVGFLAGHPDVMNLIHKNRPMYEISTLSTEFVNLLIDHEEDVLASVERLNEGKKHFISELNKMGFQTTVTHGNFLHVKFGAKKEQIDEALKDVVLYRTNFIGVKSLEGYSRFSLGTTEQFNVILTRIRSIL